MQKDIDSSRAKIAQAADNDAWVEARGKRWRPRRSAPRVLRKMKKTAEDYLGEKSPRPSSPCRAGFHDSQRQAPGRQPHRRPGGQAHHQRADRRGAGLRPGQTRRGDRKIAVYDLGGGTFDISIIGSPTVNGERSSGALDRGDTFLGGGTSTNIIDYIVAAVQEGAGVDLPRTRWRSSA